MLTKVILRQTIYVVFFLLIFSVKPAISKCPNIKDIKIVKSFGVEICAMPNVADKYLNHAKKIMDKLVDYNNDGEVDNQKVIDKIISTGSVFAVFRNSKDERNFEKYFYPDEVMEEIKDIMEQNGWDFESDEDKITAVFEPKYGTFFSVFTKEMNFNIKDWDPTIEEALHLITHMGYAQAYPNIFGQKKNSKIAKLMDEARGGYFEKAQLRYPSDAYYTYDDVTCTYSCQITEFTYWAITSLRGQLADRGKEISDEWQLNTPEKIRSKAPNLEKLLTKDEYKIFL